MLAQLSAIFAIFAYLASAAWAVAVVYGLYYLGGKLTGQDLKESESPVSAQDRIWHPHTTQSEGLPRTRAYGRNLHHGNIAAKWTDVDGNDREILYLIVEHGDGPTKGNVAGEVYINDQPAANFGDVVIQERKGTMDQTCMTGFEKHKNEYVPNIELLQNEEYLWTTPNSFFDDIEFTVAFLNGIIKYHKDGGSDTSGVHLHVRIREHPAGGWSTIFDDSIYGRQLRPLFKKYLASELGFNCTRGKQYDMGFTKTTPDGSARHVNNIHLRSLREVVDVAFERPGKALTGIKAIATSQLSGSLDIKIIREDRLVNVFDGTSWNIEYSRNRAWIDFDIVTQPVIKGNVGTWEIERYEGTDPSRLDLEFFYAWAEFCSTQVLDGYGGSEDRLACDIIVDYQTDVWTLAHEIAQIGRAYLYWRGHVLTGWIDAAVTELADLVTMDTIMARTWRNRWVDRSELAGIVEVWYRDKRQGYERTPVPFPKAQAGVYTRTVSIEATGVTTYGTAVHVANHILTRNQLIKNINTFKQYKDAFRHKLGEVIRLQHRVPAWGQGYRVISCTSNVVTLDRTVEDVNVDDLLFVRSYDEANEKVDISVYTVASTSGVTVTIGEEFSPIPIKNNNVAVGINGAVVLRRIVKIEVEEENYFNVEVETYDVALFNADNLDPDAPYPDYNWQAPAGALTKPISHDEAVDLSDLLLPPAPDIELPWPSNLNWTGSGGDTVSWSKRDADDPITFRYRGTTYEITPDSTTNKYIYWDLASPTVLSSSNTQSDAMGADKVPSCFNNDGVPDPAWGYRMINTKKVIDNAITDDGAAYTAGGQELTTVELVTIQSVVFAALGGPIFIHCTTLVLATLADNSCQFRISRWTNGGGPVLYEGFIAVLCPQDSGAPVTISIKDSPAAGTYIYKFRALKNADGAKDLYAYNTSMFVQELKK